MSDSDHNDDKRRREAADWNGRGGANAQRDKAVREETPRKAAKGSGNTGILVGLIYVAIFVWLCWSSLHREPQDVTQRASEPVAAVERSRAVEPGALATAPAEYPSASSEADLGSIKTAREVVKELTARPNERAAGALARIEPHEKWISDAQFGLAAIPRESPHWREAQLLQIKLRECRFNVDMLRLEVGAGPRNARPTALPLYPNGPQCAENGSCYGDISSETGRPKTTRVKGYYRKDGTYVRGHYRSH